MVTIEFTKIEMMLCAVVASARMMTVIEKGLPDKHGYSAAPFDNHLRGALGELAVARALNRCWLMPIDTFQKGADVGALQVRTGREFAKSAIMRPNTIDTEHYVFCNGKLPRFNVLGWMLGKDCKRPEWWGDPNGQGFAWWVPNEVLNTDLSLLPAADLDDRFIEYDVQDLLALFDHVTAARPTFRDAVTADMFNDLARQVSNYR